MRKKRALISVSNKEAIIPFAKELSYQGIEIIATGGTKKQLDAAKIQTIAIEEVTNFPEILDGRLKTLHPKIHGALLARRDLPEHLASLDDYQIHPIDFVCVNLYPFKETILKQADLAEAIENIDIGGPSMLRSAAKNYQDVTVIVDPSDYPKILEEIKEAGQTKLTTRQQLAAKAFQHTATYDTLIATYLTEQFDMKENASPLLSYELKENLRYGENNHQSANFYQSSLPVPYSIAHAKQLHGKKLSYNNIKDADAALRVLQEFDEPTVAVIKHMNPCGIGIGDTIQEAYDYAYEADPVSIFGGIVACNRPIEIELAKKMHQLFLEIIIAPAFSEEAYQLLSKKKNLRLLTINFQKTIKKEKEIVSVLGGLLIQERDQLIDTIDQWQVVTNRQPTKEEWYALQFNWKVVKHVKSNAIVVGNTKQTLGIGAGQMNRICSVKLAIEQAERAEDIVLASDAFFPMADSVQYAGEQKIKAIIQPGGSIKDQASIEMANQYNIAMVFTGTRHFKH
ncbi:bifunctional phosphoribosylaminoimidazolecarboxamide formyltransferase/IMP cyclohydrolase [Melissococcus plutonius]|uniref:Bifunctional purine biosynthesis protein PurH n=1 Tax=Melissococcus plutonius TaxID=33970 RepID=A0A2Z5Y1J5_9ENTE|nr:bifunctional phosphoribosylaminoimidazolecarboxamide formyltransferase/IMP cyclohydrolase [Melissococcus plutonius]MCV2499306.1 bifunctional phosphoribosylaminoimidazolecarboxamide formyltransferase/IMP cyclohydrolase [Melissococcus plutonius]MCV2500949.1 bifunctional phosphoribosylaminoimidazolecarboxamide formyltransferase/IMP cyclohydrolase [Melissococcus plutonius]MCV2505623.1 bifunctional phosphoribosylaminoimidazolecarboxamide formyltransferase/IMP cyclohydrolase [Melissococcus plutoniu